LEFPVLSFVEKQTLLLKYKLYVNAVVAKLAELTATLIPIEVCTMGCPGISEKNIMLTVRSIAENIAKSIAFTYSVYR